VKARESTSALNFKVSPPLVFVEHFLRLSGLSLSTRKELTTYLELSDEWDVCVWICAWAKAVVGKVSAMNRTELERPGRHRRRGACGQSVAWLVPQKSSFLGVHLRRLSPRPT
jgi:hypothetical protein